MRLVSVSLATSSVSLAAYRRTPFSFTTSRGRLHGRKGLELVRRSEEEVQQESNPTPLRGHVRGWV